MEIGAIPLSVEALGLLGIFLLMIPESACLPIPSEVTLLAAGFGVYQGRFSFFAVVLAATAGNVVGSILAYGLGRAGLLRTLKGRRARAGVSRCERMFERGPHRAVFIARLLPLARSFISLPAGHFAVPFPGFVLWTAVGCFLWCLGLVAAGLVAGTSWKAVSEAFGPVSLGLLAAGAGVTALIRRRRTSVEADA